MNRFASVLLIVPGNIGLIFSESQSNSDSLYIPLQGDFDDANDLSVQYKSSWDENNLYLF